MFAIRFALALFTIFALLLATLAAPVVEAADETEHQLEKRVTHVGQATWFYPGLGNCGFTDNDDSLIVAIPKTMYDRNNGQNCNQWIEIVNPTNSKRVWAQARDSCPGCSEEDNHLDLSPATFKAIGNPDDGVIPIVWHFEQMGFNPPQ